MKQGNSGFFLRSACADRAIGCEFAVFYFGMTNPF
jgi:hypothetical protein